MKKILTLLAAVLFAGSMMASSSQEIVFSTQTGFDAITITTAGAASTGADYAFSQNDITVTGTYGYIYNKKHTVYKTGTMVVKAGGANIDSVKLTYNSSCYPFAEALAGGSTTSKTTSATTTTFVPSAAADSVVFTNASAGKTELKNMTVYYTAEPEPTFNYYLVGTLAENGWEKTLATGMAGDSIVRHMAAGTYEFKVITPAIVNGTDATWTSALGYAQVDPECSSEGYEGSDNVKVTLTKEGDVKIKVVGGYICLIGEFGEVVVTGYTIAGAAALVGVAWDPAATANDMTQDAESGNWELVKEGVVLKDTTYQYKVVANHAWGVADYPAAGNKDLVITEAGTYNVTFTYVPGVSLTASAVKQTAPATNYTVTVTINGYDPDGHMDYAYAAYLNGEDYTEIEGSAVLPAGTIVGVVATSEDDDRIITATVNGETIDVSEGAWIAEEGLASDMAIVINFSDPEPAGCDWANIAYLGNGSGDAANTDRYKFCSTTAQVVNIQSSFGTEAGIYITVPAAITACSLDSGKYAIQGAGMLAYLSGLTAEYTDFTITDGNGTVHNVTIYNNNPVAAGSGLFVVGTMNSWNVALPAYEMAVVTPGFEFTFDFGATELVGQNFKITDATLANWSDATINLGMGTDKLNPTTAIALTNGSNTNISIADGYSSATNVVITLKNVMGEWILSATGNFVSGQAAIPDLYLRGINGDWTATDANKFTKSADADEWTLTIDVTNGDAFKVADANWGDYNFGAGSDALVLGEAYTLAASNTNLSLPFDAMPGSYTFTLTKTGDVWALTVVCNDTPVTALEEAAAAQKAVKVIENGKLVIIRNGVKYNAAGVRF